MQACDRCHTRKTRCDRRIPQCTACEKAGVPCLHADKLRQRNFPRGYIDNMEKMVQELRGENKKLRHELQQLSQAAPASAPSEPNATGTVNSPLGSSISQRTPGETHTATPSSSSGSSVDNVFALEVGYLSLIATGETRYLGSSSGMSLASMIGSAISAQSGMSLSTEPSQSDGPKVRPLHIAPSDSCFPSLAVATPFIHAYFQHTHITFPLLHRPSFMATVEKIYREPGYYESNTFDAFVFDMVLAIGSSNFNKFEEATSSASMYYAMAQSKVDIVMGLDGLSILRALLLISQHGIFSNLRDTSASIWHLVGIGARLCFELGLHLEQGQLNGGSRDFTNQVKTITLEEEMRKRCFWCLYNLDRVVSFTLGRPLVIRDEEIDVSLPTHFDDDEMPIDSPIEVSVNSDGPPKLSPFLHLIRIRRISGQILSQFYNSRQGIRAPIEEKKRIRRRFHEEIDSWKEDTKHLCIPQGTSDQAYLSSFLSVEWYNAIYNNAMLLLYRPSPYLPHLTIVPSNGNEEPELLRLLNAARTSILSYSALHRKRSLNYSWITLHGVFLAGLAYIYSVGRILREPNQRGLIPDILSIIEVTRGCSNVLVAICERWNASRRSCELFNNLSNAVIRDCLNATSKPQAPAQYQPGNEAAMTGVDASSDGNQGLGQQNDFPPPYQSAIEEGILGAMPQLDEILVMDEFRNYSLSFDSAHQKDGSFPSEVVSGFSQDWPFEIPFNEQCDFDSSAQENGARVEAETVPSWLGGE